MDLYQPTKQRRKWGFVLIIVAFLLIIGGVVLTLTRQEKILSPIPVQPSFEVIFYTPTPEAVTPTSTPSATPKLKKNPTATKTPKATPTVTTGVTNTPAVTNTPKPTV